MHHADFSQVLCQKADSQLKTRPVITCWCWLVMPNTHFWGSDRWM